MEVKIPAWNTCTLRSDGAFAVWSLADDGSLYNILGPARSTDRKMVLKAYGKDIVVRVIHKEPVAVVPEMIARDPDHEVLDKTPLEIPLMPAPTLQQRIDEQVRIALERQAEREGYESPEEAMDFEVDEDPDPVSQYELNDMQDEVPTEAMLNDIRGGTKDEEPAAGGHKQLSVDDPEPAEGEPEPSGRRKDTRRSAKKTEDSGQDSGDGED